MITFTRSDGVTSGQAVTSASDGTYSTQWTPGLTGQYTIVTSWAGDNIHRPSYSPAITPNVGGQAFSINGVDMISLPLNPNPTDPDHVFQDPSNVPFALAQWQPSVGQYKMYSTIPGITSNTTDSSWVIGPGQGYWVKTNANKVITPQGTMVNPSVDFTTGTLPAGWNQIGMPFTQAQNWGNIEVVYGEVTMSLEDAAAQGYVTDYGWLYEPTQGQYRLVHGTRPDAYSHDLTPWRGYWFRTFIPCQLIIPASTTPPPGPFWLKPSSVKPAAAPTATGANPAQMYQWAVRIGAVNGNLKDEFNYFGSTTTKAERIESPAYPSNNVDLFFTDDGSVRYAYDVKSGAKVGDSWIFQVSTDVTGDVNLTWDGVGTVPSGLHLYLQDDTSGSSVDMSSTTSYTFHADAGKNRGFHIVVRGS